MSGSIRIDRSGRAVTIWLDNPDKRNAFDPPLLGELARAARALRAEEEVAAVVLRGGGGRGFGAGADFYAFGAEDEETFAQNLRALEQALDDAFTALLQLPQPLIAALDGPCMGGAVQLALAADIRLASDTLRFAVPAAALGLVYPLAAIRRLVALAGPGMAKLILMSGREFSAADLHRAGLVEIVAPAAEFDGAVVDLCARLERQDGPAVRASKAIAEAFAHGDEIGPLQALQRQLNASEATRRRIFAAVQSRRAARK